VLASPTSAWLARCALSGPPCSSACSTLWFDRIWRMQQLVIVGSKICEHLLDRCLPTQQEVDQD
jgi:hypothetical protein